MDTRIDQITDGIYRIATFIPEFHISQNQFLIDDEAPTLIHTGEYALYENIRGAIAKVLDPKRLANLALLHWEGDENGGMDRFLQEAPQSQLVGSMLSINLNARGFGVTGRVHGVQDGDTLDLGRHKLRFLETPHVHHWDSMMVVEETTGSLFPADLFIQPGDQPPVVTEDLSGAMCELYRQVGIFAHECPVRTAADRVASLPLNWIHAMHGGTLTGAVLPAYADALRQQEFAFCGRLLGRELSAAPHPAPVA
jgi:flavorubredoxin